VPASKQLDQIRSRTQPSVQRFFTCINLAVTSLPRHLRPDQRQAQASVPAALKCLKRITSHQGPHLQETLNKRAREPNSNNWSLNNYKLNHDAPLAGTIKNRARESNPNELS
jgi:hypothetical protein